MTTYYLVYGNDVVATIEREAGAVTALPLLDEKQAMSLVNEAHIGALATSLSADEPAAFDALGLSDKRRVVGQMEDDVNFLAEVGF